MTAKLVARMRMGHVFLSILLFLVMKFVTFPLSIVALK